MLFSNPWGSNSIAYIDEGMHVKFIDGMHVPGKLVPIPNSKKIYLTEKQQMELKESLDPLIT